MIKTNSSSASPCGNPTTSECVVWQGGDIECLGIENGQTISTAIHTLATEVCSLMEQLDLSDFDLKCLFGECLECPEPEKTLTVILELLRNKICSLEDALENLDLSSSTGTDPILNLASCFQYTNEVGDLVVELPHTLYTKRIATKVCQLLLEISGMQSDISELQSTVVDLQTQIDNLDLGIPDVTSDCLYVGTKSIDAAWELLDQAFCQLRTSVGLTTDVNKAISQQCPGINEDFVSNPNWVNSPANLAQSVSNLWIAFCALRASVSTCCQVTCADVLLGFSTSYSEDGTEIILKFSSGAGTEIPTGFIDIGSTITVTDVDGNVETFVTSNPDLIANNAEITIPITGLNTTGDLTISIDANISNGSLTCSKCLSKVAKKPSCNYCEICADGTEGSTVTIVYEVASDTNKASLFSTTTSTTTSTSTTTTTTTTISP